MADSPRLRYDPAVRKLGRALQLVGLVVPLVGLMHGLQRGPRAEAWELGLLAGGVAVFLLGWQLQRGPP